MRYLASSPLSLIRFTSCSVAWLPRWMSRAASALRGCATLHSSSAVSGSGVCILRYATFVRPRVATGTRGATRGRALRARFRAALLDAGLLGPLSVVLRGLRGVRVVVQSARIAVEQRVAEADHRPRRGAGLADAAQGLERGDGG